jgi:hypothetical protein
LNPTKRKLLHAGLILFALWPLVQIGLVLQFQVNPWKLAGWGMYSAPQFPAELRVEARVPGEAGAFELRTIPEAVQDEELRFLERRLGLGRLARPDSFGRALLDYYPAIDGVTIEVRQPTLDPVSGMVVESQACYEFPRDR